MKNPIIYCSVATVLGIVAAMYPNDLQTSPEGLKLLSGYEDCTKTSYRDVGGVWTCGMGATKGIKPGTVWTEQQVAEAFVRDVKEAEQCVIKYYDGEYMPQPVFDSVTSLVYNVGCYGTRWNDKANRPTSINRFAQSHDWEKVCYHIGDFVNVGGKRIQGLVNRRTQEQKVCLNYRYYPQL